MSSELPSPDRSALRYNIDTWEADKALIRVHHSAYGATEFNPGKGGGRFHPIHDARGAAIPTIYASNTIAGAFSETIFHDIPVRGRKAIHARVLMPMVTSTLRPRRTLRLVQLRGYGLRKLGVSRIQMIESESDQYPMTRAWGAALYDVASDADGLIWTSRQHDASEAVVLFGTRVERRDLEVAAAPRPLYPPSEGWTDVVTAAEAADILVIAP